MSVLIRLALEAREMLLSLPIGFSLERAAVVWAPLLEMIDLSYLKLFTSSSIWPFILIFL